MAIWLAGLWAIQSWLQNTSSARNAIIQRHFATRGFVARRDGEIALPP
jgi:hypothetical protein